MSKVEIKITNNQYQDLGWCVLNRRLRAYAPDETIFNRWGVTTAPFKAWWPNMYRINPPNGEMTWWLTFETEKFNNDQNPDVREFTVDDDVKIRITGDGGNLKAFYKANQTKTQVQIVAYDYRYPELANTDTFKNVPWKVSLCSAIDINGGIHKIAGGLEPLYFQVSRPEGIWVDRDKITILEQKPIVWGIPEVMNFRGGI